jgi:hypothetical protein
MNFYLLKNIGLPDGRRKFFVAVSGCEVAVKGSKKLKCGRRTLSWQGRGKVERGVG